jgi:hypothetical protein
MTNPWTRINPRRTVWRLDGTAYRVWLPCDAKTFRIVRQDDTGAFAPAAPTRFRTFKAACAAAERLAAI